MAEENSNLTWGFQASQQTQWNVAQTWDDFQLDFWDTEMWDTNSWELHDVDIASSLDDESKQDNSEFDIDLWDNLDVNNSSASDSQWISSDNLETKDDSFDIDFNAQNIEESAPVNTEENVISMDMSLNDNEEALNNDPSDASSEDDAVNLFDDPTQDKEAYGNSLLDTENDDIKTLQEPDDVLWLEDESINTEENDSNESNVNVNDEEGYHNEEDLDDVSHDDEIDLSDIQLEWQEDNLINSENDNNLDIQEKWIWDMDDSWEDIAKKLVEDNNNPDLDSEEMAKEESEQELVEVTDNLDNPIERVESSESLNNFEDSINESSEDDESNMGTIWFSKNDIIETSVNESQDDQSKETEDFSLDTGENWEENSQIIENEQWNVLLDYENSSSNNPSEIDFIDDSRENAVDGEIPMNDNIDFSDDSPKNPTEWENNLLDTMEWDDSNGNSVTDDVDEIEANSDIVDSLDEDLDAHDKNLPDNTLMGEDNFELVNDVSESVSNQELDNITMSQPNAPASLTMSDDRLDGNNWFTYEQENTQQVEDSQNVITTGINTEVTENASQNLWNESETNVELTQDSYNSNIIDEDQPEEIINEPSNIQATLSLDEILDTELLTNPQFADNSTAIPQNLQVASKGEFSNRRVLTIFACIWVFILLWLTAVLAFPFNNSKRNPDEVVQETTLTWENTDSNLEHSSAPISWTYEEEPEFGIETWDFSTELNINTWGLSSSIVVFPEVDGDEDWDSELIEEILPYVWKWDEMTENSNGSKDKDNLINDIKKSISSFKDEAESYYSYGQEVPSKNIMKYSRQIIYLCDNYEQRVENWEWLDEESMLDFTTQVNEKLSKIEKEMNGWEESVITVESSWSDSYFEWKNELKEYIENRW